ncbi:DISARM anti-phage system protein DrmE domain-containing protein [Archaeoglobus neptunius]|uniref:DISARM anti-phage system protein DrmE domain-containing protein n=1 Tax=Archaeoglobus neptunius TaxID=2798580 RepID=UPI001927C21A|nr:hypothetical protein [Archaeoglobus neptunius]
MKKGKNVVIASFKPIIRPMPLIGYMASKIFRKDVEIVTYRSSKEHHNAYCLLAEANYVFLSVPPILAKQNEEEGLVYHLQPYMPKVGRSRKLDLLQDATKSLGTSNKVLFSENYLVLSQGEVEINVKNEKVLARLEPRVFLIENGKFYLKHSKYFMKFAENVDGTFLIYIQSSLNDVVLEFAKSLDAEIIYLPQSFLSLTKHHAYDKYKTKISSNKFLFTAGFPFSEDGWFLKDAQALLDMLNFDHEYDYFYPKIEIVGIKGFENLKVHLQNILKQLYGLFQAQVNIKYLIGDVYKTSTKAIRRFLPPDLISKYNPRTGYPEIEYEYYLKQIERALNRISDGRFYAKLHDVRYSFSAICNTLKQVSRPYSKDSFPDSKLMTLLKLLKQREPGKRYYICCTNDPVSTVERIVKNYLGDTNTRNGVIVLNPNSLADLLSKNEIKPNSVLVVSDPTSVFKLLPAPFDKVFVLAYEGVENYEELENWEIKKIYDTKLAIDLIYSLHRQLGIEPPKLFSKLLKELVGKREEEYLKEISRMKKVLPKVRDEHRTPSYYQKSERSVRTCRVLLEPLKGGMCRELEGTLNKRILRIEESTGFEVVTLSELKDEDVVCLIDDDDRKDLVDFLSEFVMEQVDTEFVKYWYTKLVEFLAENQMTYSEFYKIYKSTKKKNVRTFPAVRQWLLGKTLAPDDKDDLKVLGEIMDDDFLLENYARIYEEANKIRKVHRIVGRKIYNIVRGIITSDFSSITSFDDELIASRVRLYRVVSVDTGNSTP